jgi:uncharacterized integral membrane protein
LARPGDPTFAPRRWPYRLDEPQDEARIVIRVAAIVGVVVFLAVIVLAILPAWNFTATLGIAEAGVLPVILMVVGCFVVGGVLMFLIFFSARRGYDERADEFARRIEHDSDNREP